MDAVLAFVTLVSLAIAAALSVIAWHLVSVDRRRADARVAALAAEIQAKPELIPLATPEVARGLGSRWRVAGAAVSVTLAVLLAVSLWVWSGGPSSGDPVAPAGRAAPLELLSLGFERNGDRLSISGLVRNPASGVTRRGVVALVFLFDGTSGAFVASARARLHAATLRPGEESPFTIAVTDRTVASRYRIGFRAEDGDLIPHVDRRAEAGRNRVTGAGRPLQP